MQLRILRPGVNHLQDQEANWLDQLLDMVLRVREVTGKPVGIKTAIGGWQFMNLLTEAVARGYHKLLAYKDEVRGRHVRIPSVEALLGRFNDSPVQAVTLR